MIQTQTIDINHVQTVLANCPNYDTIIHYEYSYGDVMSKKLIDWYRDLIFSANCNNKDELMLIKTLDKSIYLYIRDNKYKRNLKKIISVEELTFENKSVLKEVIRKLIVFTSEYEKKEVREIDVAKWL